MDLPDGVIDIDKADPAGVTAAQQAGRPPRQPGQQSRAGRVQLLHVPVSERAQERAQR